jgi:hypothetical protein
VRLFSDREDKYLQVTPHPDWSPLAALSTQALLYPLLVHRRISDLWFWHCFRPLHEARGRDELGRHFEADPCGDEQEPHAVLAEQGLCEDEVGEEQGEDLPQRGHLEHGAGGA